VSCDVVKYTFVSDLYLNYCNGQREILLNLITWLGKYALYRWCHDIGREQAANRPLLKTIFEVISVAVRHGVLFLSNYEIFLMIFFVYLRF
jgi:hypothetical protein